MLPADDPAPPASANHPARLPRGRRDPLAIAARRLLEELAPVERERSVACLWLKPMLEGRCDNGTVGRLLRKLETGGNGLPTWGKRLREQMDLVLRGLRVFLDRRGRIDWDGYAAWIAAGEPVPVPAPPPPRRLKKKPRATAAPKPPPATSPRLRPAFTPPRFPAAEKGRHPGLLHAHRMTVAWMARRHITTLGKLHATWAPAPDRLVGAGPLVQRDLADVFGKLEQATRDNGTIDWLHYAQLRGSVLFPQESGVIAPGQYLATLAEAVRLLARRDFSPLHERILEARLLRMEPRARLLKQVAPELGLSVENFVNKEALVHEALARIFRHDDYGGLTVHLRANLLAPLREMALGPTGNPRLRPEPSEWEQLVTERWGATAARSQLGLLLLPRILGWQFRGPAPSPARATARPPRPRTLSLGDLGPLLRAAPAGLTLAELRESLGPGGPHIGKAKLLKYLDHSSQIYLFDGRYRAGSFTDVLGDACAALLQEAGQPLYLAQMTEALHPRLPRYKKSNLHMALGKALRQDPARRFEDVKGRSLYGLADWQLKSRPLAGIVEQIFRQQRRPLNHEQLMHEIRHLRPVEEKELIELLVDNPDYRRLGLALWEWNTRG